MIDALRAVTLLIGLGVAGCAATEPGNETVPMGPRAAAPQASAAPGPAPQFTVPQTAAMTPAPAPMPEPPRVAPAPAAPPPAATTAAAPPPARPAPPPPPEPKAEPQEPMTHERASSLCWMKYEDGRKKLSLDQRADLVDKCVKGALRGEKIN